MKKTTLLHTLAACSVAATAAAAEKLLADGWRPVAGTRGSPIKAKDFYPAHAGKAND
ncbi:MAG: hypothetical protein RRC34_06710 [Lentisphaeria bacterium]|nr:hypothetical protein [Lentisphaeria bacterium]